VAARELRPSGRHARVAPRVELLVFQSMWGMEQLPGPRGDWTLQQQVEAIKAAGFDGAAVEFDDAAVARRTTELLSEHELKWFAAAYPQTIDDLKETIELVHELGPDRCDHVNVQPNIRPHTVLECIPYVLGWLRLADDAGVRMYIETHRDRMTTDLLFTLQLIDAVPEIKLTADLSHFVVGREFRWPISTENDELIQRILDRSWAFHGRVASREQVQVQTSFPHHRRWVDVFLAWWERGFASWRSRAPADALLVFTPELGPPEWYAMTGPDGREMSDRWEEALQLKDCARSIWANLGP
jgi:hypothetical protein